MKIGTAVPTKYYEKVAEMGYDYVEFAGIEIYGMSEAEFELLVKKAKQIKLPIKGFNAYCTAEVPIVGEGFSKEKTAAYAKIMCERGRRLGIETVGIGAPLARMLPKDYDMALADKQAVEFTSTVAEISKEYGQTVLFEAVHKHMCDYCNLTSHCVDIVKAVNMDNVKVVLDFYHIEIMKEDSEECLKTDNVAHLHISGIGENYGRTYITEKERPMLEKIKSGLQKNDCGETITIEAEAQYFEEFAQEGLKIMREYF